MKLGAQPFIYMRTDAFSQINKESERILLDLIHCSDGRTIIYTGSGTGAMSAVVENYCTTKKNSPLSDEIKNKTIQLDFNIEQYRQNIIIFETRIKEKIDGLEEYYKARNK